MSQSGSNGSGGVAAPSAQGPFSVGVDVGGTHTDLILSTATGLVREKALTTHDDYGSGILDALTLASERIGASVEDVLSDCPTFVNGTTIVTNAITELRGAKVGVLITRGFRDTLRIAGGMRLNVYDDHLQVNPPDLVSRDCIVEIPERTDAEGNLVEAVDEQAVIDAIDALREKEVEAVAVCFLWSPLRPDNEQRAGELIEARFPEAFVTLSSEIQPVIRESERFMSAVFNCLSERATTRYIDLLSNRLRDAGFAGNLAFFQGIGGAAGERAVRGRPIALLASGPAGGVMACRYLAEQMGIADVLVGDMGGTSFDAAVLKGRDVHVQKRTRVNGLPTGLSIVDIVSVGAGGGSIAAPDARGVPQVGPRSAGSEPGPACYGQGGEEATVTDAMLVLGFLDPGNYLGGRYQLDVDAARRVIEQRIAAPLGLSVDQAAAGIHDIAVTTMTHALREVSIERGHDPRDFAFFAYGGTLPFFAVQMCRRLGCPEIVIPDNSAAFSAYGVMIADYVRAYDRTVNWNLADPDGFARASEAERQLRERAISDAREEGLDPDLLTLEPSADFRFAGQDYEVTMPLPRRDLETGDAERLAGEFLDTYERAYGKGTAWKGAPTIMVNYSIRAVHATAKPPLPAEAAPAAWDAAELAAERRSVYLPEEKARTEVPVFAETSLTPGAFLEGPAIIQGRDTTVVLPGGARARREANNGFRIAV